jgi:hypothetical protein
VDARKALQVPPQHGEVAGLAAVVQFLEQGGAHLAQRPDELVLPAHLGVGVEELGDVLHRLQVLHDLRADPGALDLHGHRLAVAEDRPMHLPERGGGDRHGVQLQEGARGAHAQLVLEDPLGLREGKGLHVVLQPRERVGVGGGEEVDAGGEQLPELDEGGPHRLQVARQLLGLRLRRRRQHRLVTLQRGPEPGLADDVRAPVLDEQSRHLAVPLQVLGSKGDPHGDVARVRRLRRRRGANAESMLGGRAISYQLSAISYQSGSQHWRCRLRLSLMIGSGRHEPQRAKLGSPTSRGLIADS